MANPNDESQKTVESDETVNAQPSEEVSQAIPEIIEENGTDTSEGPSWESKFQQMEKDFLYLRAEFENYKRNAIKERSQLSKYGAQRLALDLLDTVDVFSQALASEVSQDNWQQFVEGVKMTDQKLKQTLDKHGIKELDVIGKAFDPATQEALGTEPTSDFEDGFVCRVFKAPFQYHDKLLRAGQVFVAKAPVDAE